MSRVLLVAVLLTAIALQSLPTVAAELLEDGEKCADSRPSNLQEANARCRSGKCAPAPSIRAQTPAWYCIAEYMSCALPGTVGAAANAYVVLEGTKYQCLDPRTGDPYRFAPIR